MQVRQLIISLGMVEQAISGVKKILMRKKTMKKTTTFLYRNREENIRLKGRFDIKVIDAKSGKIKQHQIIDNLVCNTGLNAVASVLNGEGTYTGVINYLAVGTSTTTPAITDTQLGTELARTLKATSSRTNNVVTYDFSFGTTSANGTLKEAGAFIDGTASANSGQLFDHVAIDVTKTSSDVLTITLTVTTA